MSIHIEPSDSSLGAVITGVDLNALNDQSWLAVEAAWHKYAVLIFPQQHINEAQHVALGQRIGPIEILAADRKAVAIAIKNPTVGCLVQTAATIKSCAAMKAGIPTVRICPFLQELQFWRLKFCRTPVAKRSGRICAQLTKLYLGSCANVSTVLRLITLCITPKLKLVIKQAQDPVTAWAINLRHYALW